MAIAAAVPAVASAQVAVFGVMDGGYSATSVKGAVSASNKAGTEVSVDKSGGNPNGALASNRLGFRGTEKIGGMTAGFHYEWGMDAGGSGQMTSGSTAAARKSTVSLSGSFGSIEIGRDYTPIFLVSAALDASAADNVNFGKAVYLNVATTRDSGQVSYTTPSLSGLVVKLSGTIANNKQSAGGNPLQSEVNTEASAFGYSATYRMGAVNLMLAGGSRDEANGDNRGEAIIGATWAPSKQLTLLAASGAVLTDNPNSQYRFISVNGTTSSERIYEYRAYQLGARYMIDPKTQLHVTWGQGEAQFVPTCKIVSCAKATVKRDFDAYKLGLIHSLSNRTRLYALYGADDGRMDTDTGASMKRSEFAFGLNHAF